jgi:glycine/D-amino acid oxidase-like deaminating enzyme/nitrite reductase/ring-hydroxylating ferredoxin subunit
MTSNEIPKNEDIVLNQMDSALLTSGNTKSSWFANAQPIKFTKLDRDISKVDVVVVGGGIAGISTAYLLSKAGKKVVVVEDGYIGSGETGRTTAHITHAIDDRYYNLERLHGIEGARIAAESHTAAIDAIESIVNEEKINCEFERLDGFLFLDPTDKNKSLKDELEATHRAGINNTELIERAPLSSFDTGPCIRFPNQAQFQPLKYLAGLTEAIIRNDGEIFTETHAREIKSTDVKTSDGYSISAKNIVVATNAPIIDSKTSKIYDKQEPYRTYVIAARIKKGSVPKGLYWDTGDKESKNTVPPYHYVRIENNVDNDFDLLIIGGEDHKVGDVQNNTQERFTKLTAWAKERFPIQDIKYSWSGQVMEPTSSMAFIGHNPNDDTENNNIYISTGDSGNGMTHGTIAGILLTDMILGKENHWASLYDPSNKPNEDNTDKSEQTSDDDNSESNKENNKVSDEVGKGQYHKTSLDELSVGQGKVIEGGGKGVNNNPIAIYRDEKKELHVHSGVCTHLGCTVMWNPVEKSFDCPCHGSRFSSSTGQVINGPANDPLEETTLS